MTTHKWSAQALMAKQLLDIETGTFLDGYNTWLIDPDTRKLSALVDQTRAQSICFEDVKNFSGDVIILQGSETSTVTCGASLISLPVVTSSGTVVGRILDFAVDETGNVLELLLVDGLVAAQDKCVGVLSMRSVVTIGAGALISDVDAETLIFSEPDAVCYQVVLDRLASETKQEGTQDDVFEQMTRRFTASVSDFSNRVSDRVRHVDTDNLMKDFTRFTVGVNKEVGRLFESLAEQFSNRKKDIAPDDVDMVMQDLGGHTVQKPVHDRAGQVIIMPGQLVNEERIRQVLAADKIAELYRVAISIESQEVNHE